MTFQDNFKEKERDRENGGWGSGWGRRVGKKIRKMVALVIEREGEDAADLNKCQLKLTRHEKVHALLVYA
jgi:hypothetical protein